MANTRICSHSKTDHVLDHNTSTNKLKKEWNHIRHFSDHNGMTRNQLQERKNYKYGEIKPAVSEQLLGNRRKQEEKKIPQDKGKLAYNIPKSMGWRKSSSRGEYPSNKGLLQETREISNK